VDDHLTSYSAAIEKLFARTTSGTKFGLERTQEILARLGSPERRFPSVHVAGTNGKGSVVATTEALLRANRLKVGRYTSPHLIDFRERITVNGVPIPETDVLRFLETWIPAAESMGATFFELTTALAFDWFATQAVDVAVIETGLGGRLDSTNVLTPRVATVTSIGLDHTELLGRTLEAIAREKAGIFKAGVPAVIGEPNDSISDLLEQCARDAGARPITVLDHEYAVSDVSLGVNGTSFTLLGKQGGGRPDSSRQTQAGHPVNIDGRLTTPLLGVHQARNTATAIATVQALGDAYLPRAQDLSAALAKVFLPGRFQRLGNFIFDVAHNPDGARAVAESINVLDPGHPRIALLAVLADKDWSGIIRALAPAVDAFVVTNAPSAPEERRWNPEEAFAFANAQKFDATLEPDLDSALAMAKKSAATVLVTGSFHTVGDVMSRLQVSPFAA
jgi:dihydrofolate synthase / folylpolyglutamate synthase